MVDGNSFGFTPYQFGLICSDLSAYPISRAVAASSAFPGAFDAIVLKNYAGSCELEEDPWLARSLTESDRTSRRFRAATRMSAYLDPEKKPFIHLFDGGVSDNLGLRGPLDFVVVRGGIDGYLESMGQHNVRRVAFIIVNAAGKASFEWSLRGKLAGITRVLGISSDVLLSSYTYETIELLRSYTREWSKSSNPGSRLECYVIEVSFEALSDEDERRYFQQVPTTLALPKSTVEKLSAVGRRILYESDEFTRLVQDLGAEIPPPLDNPTPPSP
jgi:NTE family protein